MSTISTMSTIRICSMLPRSEYYDRHYDYRNYEYGYNSHVFVIHVFSSSFLFVLHGIVIVKYCFPPF